MCLCTFLIQAEWNPKDLLMCAFSYIRAKYVFVVCGQHFCSAPIHHEDEGESRVLLIDMEFVLQFCISLLSSFFSSVIEGLHSPSSTKKAPNRTSEQVNVLKDAEGRGKHCVAGSVPGSTEKAEQIRRMSGVSFQTRYALFYTLSCLSLKKRSVCFTPSI